MKSLLYLVFLLLAVNFITASSKVKLTIQPGDQNQRKKLGESLYLECLLENAQDESTITSRITWTGPHGYEIKRSERVYVEDLDNGVGKALYITNIEEEDAGVYNCSVVYGNLRMTTSTNLETIRGITFENAPAEQYAILGKVGYLKCQVTANPPAKMDWQKHGITGPIGPSFPYDDERISVQPGQIKITQVLMDDEGAYLCRARVPQTGEFKEKKINFQVYTPPEFITRIDQEQEAVESEEVSLKCQAQGKPLPTYTWTDDENADLAKKEGFAVSPDGTLTIKKVKSEDSGKYTCTAKNKADEIYQSLKLRVIMKPKIVSYENVTVNVHKNAVLECTITGDPLPTVTLRKLTSEKPYTEGLQADDNRITLHITEDKENHLKTVRLEIEDVNRTDDGLYACESMNKGGELYVDGHITAQYPPSFEYTPMDEAWSWDNKKVNLTCHAESIPNATISWIFRRLPSESDRNLVKIGTGPTSVLEVNPVDSTYFYTYTCVALNSLGEARHEIRLEEARVPSEINQVVFSSVSATTITFKFMGPTDNGGQAVDAYAVQYRMETEEWDDDKKKIWPVEVPYILEGLYPRVTYVFRFAARNAVGFGHWGANQKRTMNPEGVPESPKIMADYVNEDRVQFIDSPNSFELRWRVPLHNGKEIDKFDITVFKVKNVTWEKYEDQMKRYTERHPGRLIYPVTGLSSNSYYKIEVRAHNAIGFSEPGYIIIKTAEDTRMPGISVSDDGSTASSIMDITTQGSTGTTQEIHETPDELLSTPEIVGIIVAIVFVLLVVVDLYLCRVHKTGLMWLICRKVGRSDKRNLDTIGKDEKEPLSNNKDTHESDYNSKDSEKKPLEDDVIVKAASKDSVAKDTAV